LREEERVVLFNDAVSFYVYRASVVDESMRNVYLLKDGCGREVKCSEHKTSPGDIYHKSHMEWFGSGRGNPR